MTTFVTSFTLNVNKREDRKIEDYIEHGKKLLKQPYSKVIFMEPELIPQLKEYSQHIEEEDSNVKNTFIPYSITDIYLYSIRDQFPNHSIQGNSEKDTQNYFIIMNNKTELLKKAIELNVYNTNNFVWIDFGIFHIFKGNEQLFENSLKSLLNIYPRIRAGSCWDPNKHSREYLTLDTVVWFFAGGILGGNKKNLSIFAMLCKNKLLEIIEQNKTITWEVNVWYEVYKQNPQLFSLYQCDHDFTLISEY